MTNSTVTDPVMLYDAVPLHHPASRQVLWVIKRYRPIHPTEVDFHKNMKRVKGERL